MTEGGTACERHDGRRRRSPTCRQRALIWSTHCRRPRRRSESRSSGSERSDPFVLSPNPSSMIRTIVDPLGLGRRGTASRFNLAVLSSSFFCFFFSVRTKTNGAIPFRRSGRSGSLQTSRLRRRRTEPTKPTGRLTTAQLMTSYTVRRQ